MRTPTHGYEWVRSDGKQYFGYVVIDEGVEFNDNVDQSSQQSAVETLLMRQRTTMSMIQQAYG